MTKLFKFLTVMLLLIATSSCLHKSRHNKINKDVTVQELVDSRDSAIIQTFDDSVYYHMPDVIFACVVYDIINKYHPNSIDDITHKLIANTYISNKTLYDGVYRGYLLRKSNDNLNKLIDEKTDSSTSNIKQNGDTSNCDR